MELSHIYSAAATRLIFQQKISLKNLTKHTTIVYIVIKYVSSLLEVTLIQGLLKLLWTVYPEGKLQWGLSLRNFQNSFNKDRSIRNTMHKKDLKFALVGGRVSEDKFYLYHSTVESRFKKDFGSDQNLS